MTIDNAIKHMEQARYDYCEYWEETRNDTTIAFDIAINTMRKYQKIQEIAKKAILPQYAMELVDEIREVIEDENDMD